MILLYIYSDNSSCFIFFSFNVETSHHGAISLELIIIFFYQEAFVCSLKKKKKTSSLHWVSRQLFLVHPYIVAGGGRGGLSSNFLLSWGPGFLSSTCCY